MQQHEVINKFKFTFLKYYVIIVARKGKNMQDEIKITNIKLHVITSKKNDKVVKQAKQENIKSIIDKLEVLITNTIISDCSIKNNPYNEDKKYLNETLLKLRYVFNNLDYGDHGFNNLNHDFNNLDYGFNNFEYLSLCVRVMYPSVTIRCLLIPGRLLKVEVSMSIFAHPILHKKSLFANDEFCGYVISSVAIPPDQYVGE